MESQPKILCVYEDYGDSGRVNARHYELIRRFVGLDKLSFKPRKGWRRVQRAFLGLRLKKINKKYDLLYDPGAKFIKWWPGKVVVDIDDPTFSNQEIALLRNRHIHCIVTTTEVLKNKLTELTGKTVKVIPSGFSLRDIDRSLIQKLRSQRKAGEVIIGYASPYVALDFSKSKQFDISLLMEAMEIVWSWNPKAKLWLFGEPDEQIKLVAKRNPNIRLFGLIPRKLLVNYISILDIATYPRLLDHGGRFSVKLIEYMGCGIPIVATKVSESQIVKEAQAGIVASDAIGFAYGIRALWENKDLYRELKNNALNFSKRFDWDIIADRYRNEVFLRCG